MPPQPQADQPHVITKRRVTMRSVVLDPATGNTIQMEATDYVDAGRPGVLEEYVRNARLRWQYVAVSEEPDAGPDGWDGATTIPFGVEFPVRGPDGSIERVEFHEFQHPLAGTHFPATGSVPDEDELPRHPRTGARTRVVHAGQEG